MILVLLACAGGDSLRSSDARDAAGDPSDGDASSGCWDDDDGDGYGSDQPRACGDGASAVGGDCDDANRLVGPDAPEVCDGIDNDCDGRADDADAVVDGLPFWSDADGDGYGDEGGAVTACALGEGLALEGGDCDDTDATVHPGADETCDGVDRDCDGYAPGEASGAAEACPAVSCGAALALSPGADDGAIWITAPSGTVTRVWCDQTTDGGGWTLGFLHNTASTALQIDFGVRDVDVDLLAQSPAEASASSSPAMAWMDLARFDWTELRLEAAYMGETTYTSRAIPRASLRLAFGDNGYYLYGEEGYYWCGGDASYTDAGVGAVNNPEGAPEDCRGHGSLGTGWDFSETPYTNTGLTLCGTDGSYFMAGSWASAYTYYGAAGAAQAIYVR